MRNLLLSLPALLGSACVLTPTDGDTLTSQHDLLDFTGGAAGSGNAIAVEAWNYERGEFERVASTAAASSKLSTEPDMFRWNAPGVDLADRHWVQPGTDCTSSGMARLRVLEQRGAEAAQLLTFDAGGQACLSDKLSDGVHPVGAGNACHTGDEIVLYAPPRCVRVPVNDISEPLAVIRANSGAAVWTADSTVLRRVTATTTAAQPIAVRASGRDLDSGVRVADLDGTASLTCVRGTETRTETFDLDARATGPWRRGELAETGLDASLTVMPTSYRTRCPAGFTATQLRLTVSAFVENNGMAFVDDKTAISPEIQLTMSLR